MTTGGILPDAEETHPFGYDWSQRLDEIRVLSAGEGYAQYAAVGEGAFWIVNDSGTMADS